jgi:hypothetical protein
MSRRPPPRNFRVSVEGTSICIFHEVEAQALDDAARWERLAGRPALVVQLLPEYRVIKPGRFAQDTYL